MKISKSKKEFYSKDIGIFPLKPNKKYRLNLDVTAFKGKLHSAYIAMMIFSRSGAEIRRYIKWISNFDGKKINYTIIFSTKKISKYAILGYRFNIDTPIKSDLEIEIPINFPLKLDEIESNSQDVFDKYSPSQMSPLNENQENRLEKKLVWIFGSPRSGSTWLGADLLTHPNNRIWSEPQIGRHLDCLGSKGFENGPVDRDNYFFSLRHKIDWLPALRKLILTRAFSQTQNFDKNIIIKEPAGSGVAHIIMESLPNSKLIFLTRDGHDVVDSIVDAHQKNSWSKVSSELKTQEARKKLIQISSNSWVAFTQNVKLAYDNHNKKLRHLIKYEDLRKDTFSELRKIYDFLGIKIPDEQLKRKIERFDFTKIPDSEKGSGKFARSASPGGWKSNFNKEEQSLMNSIMGEILKIVGYED